MAKFIIWAGSKGKLIEEIKKHIPNNKEYSEYVEPFLGSGVILEYMLKRFPNVHGIANDINSVLINAFNVLKEYPTELEVELEQIERKWRCIESSVIYNAEYAEARAKLNRMISTKTMSLALATSFLTVNHTCYNGLYRINSNGFCNTPAGDRFHAFPTAAELQQLSELFQQVSFTNVSGTECIYSVEHPECTLLYIDPPYRPISKTSSFTEYVKGGFSETDAIELAKAANEAAKAGATVIMHQSYSPDIEDWGRAHCPDLMLHIVEARRNINCKGGDRGKIKEVIFATN